MLVYSIHLFPRTEGKLSLSSGDVTFVHKGFRFSVTLQSDEVERFLEVILAAGLENMGAKLCAAYESARIEGER